MNVVYQSPTIASFTNAILGTISEASPGPSSGSTVDDLIRLAERYSANLSPRPSTLTPRPPGKDVVLITGTTGGFGCDVLAHLLLDDDVATVYAFNRKQTGLSERQASRFRERGIEGELLSSPKLRLLEAELDQPGFGIDTSLLEEVRGCFVYGAASSNPVMP